MFCTLDRTDVNILVRGYCLTNSVRWYYWDKLWLLYYLLQLHVNQQLSQNKKFNKERRKKKKKKAQFLEKPTAGTGNTHTLL